MIREWLRRSVIVHPTVCLIQASDTPREIEQAINRGASRTEIEEIFLKESVKETKYLYPAVYPRSHFLWVFTTTIDGFRFASPFFHPPYARRAMRKGVLDVAEQGLILKDADGKVVLPKQAENAL